MRFAAIDLGTVTCRLLVADVREGGENAGESESESAGAGEGRNAGTSIIPLAKEYAIVNLGEGVDETHRLAPQALARVKETLTNFCRMRDGFDTPENPILSTACVATSASRDAENAEELEAMFTDLGLSLQVIPGEREAELTFMGVGSAFPNEKLIVVDVGGGSTEVIFGTTGAGAGPDVDGAGEGSGTRSAQVESVHSYDIGSRRITERFLHSDPPTQDQLVSARAHIRRTLLSTPQSDRILAALSQHSEQPVRLVAVAGTATTAVSVRDHMEVYDSARVHGSTVSEQELAAITHDLAAVPLAQREHIVGLDPGRAPVIVAGLVILQEVMRLYRQTGFTVSESDILSGIIISEYEKALIRLSK